jgi:hypothetical protein
MHHVEKEYRTFSPQIVNRPFQRHGCEDVIRVNVEQRVRAYDDVRLRQLKQ